ncbi:hypothetical protein [Clostridium grantii]|uniref:Uncharacterized protein n=1 Tax=Clostridium grantii DSM 8605 TaxID=1121316 RepID=A0A1M5U972_9CLOT|nr:hypothetical protein [Clostridium grantii]SHH59470.1 hypothetical protein SAMN02745207_01649 [Clostridium grantii DSM 8605]
MYSSEIMGPLGNIGMTLLASNKDDTTISVPDIGFDFFYDGVNCRSTMKTSGNSWVGFTGSSEQLKVNRRDTRAEKVYYANETINGSQVFRLRWEGDHYYSAYGAYDILWELILYKDSSMVLIIEKITNDGTDSFVNPNVGTITYDFLANKSYTFIPTEDGGRNYTIQEGSYVEANIKYLIVDGTDIKHWDTGSSQYVKISELPITAQAFQSYGDASFHIERTGLVSNNPILKIWSDNESMAVEKIIQTAVPKASLIEMKKDILFNDDYIQGINDALITVENTGSGVIRFILSNDSGVTWKTFYGAWVDIDKNDLNTIKTSGMSINTISSITETEWQTLCGTSKKVRFAFCMEISSTSDVLKINEIRLNYNLI